MKYKTYCKNGHERVPDNLYRNGYCKVCRRAYTRAYRLANPDKSREQERQRRLANPDGRRLAFRQRQLKSRYNLSPSQYEVMLGTQNNACAICFATFVDRNPSVDHVHDDTKRVRGLLCQQCNAGLGMFKDSTTALANAIAYLKKEVHTE